MIGAEGDLNLGWFEFAMEVNGVEMLKDVNVEEMVEDKSQVAIMEAFDVTGLRLNVDNLEEAKKKEIRYIYRRTWDLGKTTSTQTLGRSYERSYFWGLGRCPKSGRSPE